ncbi:MAG: acyl-CoA/acyl-ACP dehydrogenase [Acidimicrobiales bacterium]|nr:acyl-CoA/acyl-ACP dehydrogenase [Acidimicrobiales bacterium]
MDFELSDDQVALADAARDLLDGYAAPAAVRARVDGDGGTDPALWDAMVSQGWTAIAVPEALGGMGLGWVELAVLLEQLGAHVAPAPFLQHALATDALVRAAASGNDETGDDGSVAGWLERLVAATALGAVAFQPVTPEADGDGWVLTGTPEPVPFGPDAALVVVRSDDALFAVEVDDAVRPTVEPAMDRTRALGWLRLDRAPAIRLGGIDAVEAFCDAGATAYAAELLGIGARSLELAVAYAGERQQFGRPIGSFQAIKHRCADMLVDVEGMRSVVYYAAWCLAAGDDDRSVAASTAKTWCSDAATRVVASCLQVHGGIGFTWECDVHLYLKRAQLDRISFGDATHHRARLGALLRARVEAGASVI